APGHQRLLRAAERSVRRRRQARAQRVRRGADPDGRVRRDRADRRARSMRIVIRLPQVLVAVGLVSLGAVGLAAIAQHVFDMQPCPWCVLQRLIYIVVGVLALVAAALPGLGRRLSIVLALLGTLCGLASALWQQLHAV